MRTFTLLGIVLLSAAVAACNGKGADYELVTDQGDAELKKSIRIAAKDMSHAEARAFLWALESISLDEMAAAYPNASPRTIYRAVATEIMKDAPAEIAHLEAVRPRYDSVLAELKKINAVVTGFRLEKSFHGLQPTITANISNGSSFNVGLIRWRAELFIDGQAEPVAVATLTDSYDNSQAPGTGGLPAGESAGRSFTIGFVRGDPAWTTLAIQNARSRRVVIVPIYSGIQDFNNKTFLAGAPHERISALKDKLATARQIVAM